jgi:hypothetical protein
VRALSDCGCGHSRTAGAGTLGLRVRVLSDCGCGYSPTDYLVVPTRTRRASILRGLVVPRSPCSCEDSSCLDLARTVRASILRGLVVPRSDEDSSCLDLARTRRASILRGLVVPRSCEDSSCLDLTDLSCLDILDFPSLCFQMLLQVATHRALRCSHHPSRFEMLLLDVAVSILVL